MQNLNFIFTPEDAVPFHRDPLRLHGDKLEHLLLQPSGTLQEHHSVLTFFHCQFDKIALLRFLKTV